LYQLDQEGLKVDGDGEMIVAKRNPPRLLTQNQRSSRPDLSLIHYNNLSPHSFSSEMYREPQLSLINQFSLPFCTSKPKGRPLPKTPSWLLKFNERSLGHHEHGLQPELFLPEVVLS
jgi:hypothetical protein